MRIDSGEAVEDLMDFLQIDIEPGDIWGRYSSNLYLVIRHEECGCVFLRAVAISGPAVNQLIAQRDEQLQDYFLDSGYKKLGHIETYIQCNSDRPFKKKIIKKTKKSVKPKASRRSRI